MRPHVPTFSHCNLAFPPHRNLTDHFILQCTKAASWRVDSTAAGIECLPRAALKRRHVSFCPTGPRPHVSADARCTTAFQESVQTFSDRHDQQRHVASASRFRQGRSRLRARRGRVADRDQRRALSRLHLRRCGECAGTRASASGQGAAGAGDEALAHVEPVQEPGWRQARGAAVRTELCRLRVLLQFRRGGDGMRDQGRAPISRLQGPSRALSHHHLRRRVPRPHAGDAGGDRLRQISRRLWSADGRL